MRTITIEQGVNESGNDVMFIEDNDDQFAFFELIDGVAYFISKLHFDEAPVATSIEISLSQAQAELMFLLGLINYEAVDAMREGF